MARILLVEDSSDIVAAVQAVLKSEHDILAVTHLADAQRLLSESSFDLVLLDIDLPDGNGVEFFAQVAQVLEDKGIGTILLTGTNTVSTRTRSFSLGALDYIPKPFDLAEFHARVNSKLRNRPQPSGIHKESAGQIKSGKLELDLTRQQVFELNASGEPRQIDLTPVEFRLLLLFLQNVGEIVPRAQILETVWGQSHVSSRCVDHHVCGLRKKIQTAGGKIESVYGIGYRIEAA